MANFKEALNKVKAFVFDVDGVFADARIVLYPNGDMMRTMNTKDGFAVKYAYDKGFPIAIITGGASESVKTRFKNLGLTDIYLGSTDKIEDYKDFVFKYNLSPDDILYMGDDLPDYQVMKMSGIPTCPADAVPEIKAISMYISDYTGGNGCVRDVIEQTLRTQNKWGLDFEKNYKQ